jgi:acetylglutamate kinase
MNFAKDSRGTDMTESFQRAQMLVEALPWIKAATGKTVVIKYGGAAMVNDDLRRAVMSDIVLLKIIGLNPIIVHGGGAEVSEMMGRLGIPVEFKSGLRVTTPETMDIVKQVLVGTVNQELVAAMNEHGNIAVGMCGADAHMIEAAQTAPELGLVGTISCVDTTYLEDVISADYIPVIASVAVGADGKTFYNVNADAAAGEIAAAIGAHKVLFLTDVDGLYEDFDDKDSLISNMTLSEAKELLADGRLSTGMIPKITAITTALSAGVNRAHILNGTIAHCILLEIFTDEGVGTMVKREAHDVYSNPEFETFPVEGIASKL